MYDNECGLFCILYVLNFNGVVIDINKGWLLLFEKKR